jgi:CDP-glucose 4,6-dehydratase
MNLKSIYNRKKILVTGNTGFKGSWLATWLKQLGAEVIGLSKDIPTIPSIFVEARHENKITYLEEDIKNIDKISKIISDIKPDFVFHLAAQPLVRLSYDNPLLTIESNALGTANVLESLRISNHKCTAVFITSDKAYDNVEWTWGYRENDPLGGKDPYSASKGMAELAIKTYAHSFFSRSDSNVKVAVGRAGNVIGGGDWAKDRIVPDAMRSWSKNEALEIRSPFATRPWQHVLEPLSGYLLLGAMLYENPKLNSEAFNFGPGAEQNFTVSDLLTEMKNHWPGAVWKDISSQAETRHEAGLLKLCCDKALHTLGWKPSLTFEENCAMTVEWYRAFYQGKADVWELTLQQIQAYSNFALERKCGWTI